MYFLSYVMGFCNQGTAQFRILLAYSILSLSFRNLCDIRKKYKRRSNKSRSMNEILVPYYETTELWWDIVILFKNQNCFLLRELSFLENLGVLIPPFAG